MKKEIDPNLILDVASELISDRPPKTFVGRVLRWFKLLNKTKNDLGLEIKKRSI